MSKRKVYVAGPYTLGDVCLNVRNAVQAGNELANQGLIPFIPHLSHFWHMLCPRPYDFWLDYDNQFLPHCDALLRLLGESSGSDKEVELAKSLGIPVFHSIEEVFVWERAQL